MAVPVGTLTDNSGREQVLGDGPKQTGGRHIEVPSTGAFPKTMQQFADELRARSAVTYVLPDGVKPDKRFSISSKRKGITLRAPTAIPNQSKVFYPFSLLPYLEPTSPAPRPPGGPPPISGLPLGVPVAAFTAQLEPGLHRGHNLRTHQHFHFVQDFRERAVRRAEAQADGLQLLVFMVLPDHAARFGGGQRREQGVNRGRLGRRGPRRCGRCCSCRRCRRRAARRLGR